MQAVQQELDRVNAEIQATQQKLAAAEHAKDEPNIEFLRKDVTTLREQQNLLREQQTLRLRVQVSGHYLWSYPRLARTGIQTPVCANHVWANFPHCPVALKNHNPAGRDTLYLDCFAIPF